MIIMETIKNTEDTAREVLVTGEEMKKKDDTLSLKKDKTGAIGLIVGVIIILVVLAFFGIFGLSL